ncbi:putative aldolase [Pantoea agglomerans]|uniref:Putative aldolase n=1 Tax=Enterobacter agglomerans TaxID=549 RepID=A0A379AEP3_ENTAG|nr:putative aldolase [Pantoea agglomerans]
MSESFSLTEQQARDEMVRLGASFFQRGYATGSAGNLSMLLEDGNLLATPHRLMPG